MMNLFEEYKKRRALGMKAAEAHRSVRNAAATEWRKELRGWDFNVREIIGNMNGKAMKSVWWTALPSGNRVVVKAGFDYDVNQLDGLCKLEHHQYKEHDEQGVISHKDGTYWIELEKGYAIVELDDGGIETKWYRKQGMAKQPAIEKAIEQWRKMVSWIEDYARGNCSYGCFEVCVMSPDGRGADNAVISSAGPLGGVEMDDEEYLLDTLNELFDEATHGLTL